ncbi:hypothetical protein T265_08131 [Opisthorchis viverrini]|uniref:Uncharacterized protein n=1 Tax=Opisthorchis viverrini TaxID=6198 RepID=A0A074ZA81_OPIVI|nr:hypothetical protein T265_08131 [Opisthorchis viverrini]KER24146.1 hypothetical protein T265_08131 [Opisthorchis viverrini]
MTSGKAQSSGQANITTAWNFSDWILRPEDVFRVPAFSPTICLWRCKTLAASMMYAFVKIDSRIVMKIGNTNTRGPTSDHSPTERAFIHDQTDTSSSNDAVRH